MESTQEEFGAAPDDRAQQNGSDPAEPVTTEVPSPAPEARASEGQEGGLAALTVEEEPVETPAATGDEELTEDLPEAQEAQEAAVPEPVSEESSEAEPVEAQLIEASEPEAEPVVEEPVVEEPAAEAEPAPSEDGRESRAARRRRGDPLGGPGEWYVVHTYAGYENKVKANLESRIHSMQMEDKIFDIHVPMEDVMEIKGGKKQVVQRKVFPGYLLVKMFYDNDSWYVVRHTPGVTGFVSSGTGTKPTPLSKREVEKILSVKKETEAKPSFRLEFEVDDTVRIISGPFADFNGTVSEINVDQSKLKVLVSIFDRETPVELGFDQVAKV